MITLDVAIRDIYWELKRELGWKVLEGSFSDAVSVSRVGKCRACLMLSLIEPLSDGILQTPIPYQASHIFIPFLHKWHRRARKWFPVSNRKMGLHPVHYISQKLGKGPPPGTWPTGCLIFQSWRSGIPFSCSRSGGGGRKAEPFRPFGSEECGILLTQFCSLYMQCAFS